MMHYPFDAALCYANFVTTMPKSVESEPTMKFRITKVLRFWVECEFPDYRA
jgi:hypothetical protein